MSSRKHRIIKNTVSNIGVQIISAFIPLILLPYMLRYWGREAYGILVLVYSFQAFMTILNTAIHITLMKYVAEVYELRDFKRFNTIVNDFWLVGFSNNLVVSLIIIVIGAFGLHWLNVSKELIVTAKQVFYIMGISGILVGCFSTLDGIMVGIQKMHENNFFRGAETILAGVAAISVLYFRQSLVVYVTCLGSIPVLIRMIQFSYVKRILPQIHFNIFRFFNFKELIKLSKFSGYQIINQVSDNLMYNTDKLIIQKIMGPASLVMYEIANKPNILFQQFISLPLSAILPACSAAYARGDRVFLDKMLIMGTRVYLVLVLPVIVASIMLMKQFILLWLGKDYLDVVLVAQLFLLTFIVACPFKIFSHMMVSKARVKEYGLTKFIYAIINVPLSIFFIWKMGIIGGVIVTFGFWLFVHVPTNIYIMSNEHISSLEFFKRLSPLIISIVLEIFTIFILTKLGFGKNWAGLSVVFAISLVVMLIFSVFLILNKEERSLIGLKY